MSRAAGQRGEAYAKQMLEGEGYRILASNYHSRYGEIDLIAAKGDTVAFVEVKTRREGAMVSGGEAVGAAKQRRIIQTALLYLQETGCGLQPRFDLLTVITGRGGQVLRHTLLMGAFDGEAYSQYQNH